MKSQAENALAHYGGHIPEDDLHISAASVVEGGGVTRFEARDGSAILAKTDPTTGERIQVLGVHRDRIDQVAKSSGMGAITHLLPASEIDRVTIGNTGSIVVHEGTRILDAMRLLDAHKIVMTSGGAIREDVSLEDLGWNEGDNPSIGSVADAVHFAVVGNTPNTLDLRLDGPAGQTRLHLVDETGNPLFSAADRGGWRNKPHRGCTPVRVQR